MSEGLSNRQIAERLVISKRTVDAHIEHIYGKLGVSSRVAAGQLAQVVAAVRWPYDGSRSLRPGRGDRTREFACCYPRAGGTGGRA